MNPTDQSIKPALAPEVWTIVRDQPATSERPNSLFAGMAIANHNLPDGDPRKITRADVDALRDVLGTNRDDAPDYNGMLDSLDVARAAVVKLAALLPPE